MRWCRALSSAFLLVCLVSPISAQESCKPEDVLRQYLAHKYPKETNLRIAAYDHLTGTWIAREWDGVALTPTLKRYFSVDPANEPTLIVPAHGKVAVFVINTNPALYATKVTGVTRTDISSIDNLKSFAGLFGGFVSTNVADLAGAKIKRTLGPLPPAPPPLAPGEVFEAEAYREERDPLTKLTGDVNDLWDALRKPTQVLGDANNLVSRAADKVEADAEKIAASRDNAVVFLQLAEADSPSASLLADLDTLAKLDTKTADDFSALRDGVAELQRASVDCPEVIAAIDQAFKLELDGIPVPSEDAKQQADLWQKLLAVIDKASITCADSDIARPAEGIGVWLRNNPPKRNGLTGDAERIVREARELTTKFVKQVALRDKQTKDAAAVLAKRGDALKTATQIALLAQQQRTYLGDVNDASPCWVRAGVLEVQRATGSLITLPFTKVQNEDISIKIRPTFAKDVETRHDDIDKRTYHFARNLNFDIDTGVVWTRIADREFKVIDRPAPTATDAKATEKAIQQVSETTRAGKLGLLLTARPAGRLSSFGAQIGFGLDTDNPSALLGIGFSMARYAKISGGRTWQRVTRLQKGLVVGQKLDSEDQFAVREVFRSDWYLALSITLDDLPFFAPKK